MSEKNFFGKNWKLFIKQYMNSQRIEGAKNSLKNFLGEYSLEGKSFIDVGCGSGLFSLAAYRLKASRVISFDADPLAVECCKHLHEKEGNPQNWQVMYGSILDQKFVEGLGKFDVVYSWGVLHHTGNIWKSLENAIGLVKDKGLLYIAIYNRCNNPGFHSDGRFGTSYFWLRIKKIYSKLPSVLQSLVDFFSVITLFFIYIIALKNPIKKFREYSNDPRGMPFRIIVRDWLGGYPYEFASVEETFNFIKKYGFVLENIKTTDGLMNNEYLFKKI